MITKQIIKTQPTEENPIVVQNYPYGRHRTQIRYWVETVKRKGDRFCAQTLNPKTQLWNKPKKDTYQAVIIVYKKEETGYISYFGLRVSTSAESYKKFVKTAENVNFNALQEEQLKVIRSYIKAYEGVTFECVEINGLSEEERKKHEEQQDKVQNQINHNVAVNYNNDNGSL